MLNGKELNNIYEIEKFERKDGTLGNRFDRIMSNLYKMDFTEIKILKIFIEELNEIKK